MFDFLGPPAESFRTLFPILGPKSPNDPCSRQKFSQVAGFGSGRPGFGKIYARKLWADFSIPMMAIFSAHFSALFFQDFSLPRTFTPKIHAQNCRHFSPIHFLEPKLFSRRFSAYWGDQQLLTWSMDQYHNMVCLSQSRAVFWADLFCFRGCHMGC